MPVVQSNNQTVICEGYGTSSFQVLDEFKSVSVDDIKKIILATKNKSCSLDKIPMQLLKENIDCLIKPITTIINISFSSGVSNEASRGGGISHSQKIYDGQEHSQKLSSCLQHWLHFQNHGDVAVVCLVCVTILCVFSLVCVCACTVGVYGVCADPGFYGICVFVS